MIVDFHHVGCLVPDIQEGIADYLILHPNAEVSPVIEVKDQGVKVCFLQIGKCFVEFVEPLDEGSSLYRMLSKRPGFYHIGIFTDDIDAEIERLEGEGYHKINKFRSEAFGNRYCSFLYNKQMHLIELIESE